jgi:dynein heavy chain
MECTLQCEQLTGKMTKILEASEQLTVLNSRLAMQKMALAEKTAACEQYFAEITEGKWYSLRVYMP